MPDIQKINEHNVPQEPVVIGSFQKITSSIVVVVHKVMDLFVRVLSFPLRYLGSKTWYFTVNKGQLQSFKKEGYHPDLTALSRQDLRRYVRYAAATVAVVKNDADWMVPFGYKRLSPLALSLDPSRLPPGMSVKEECFFDSTTGLKGTLFQSLEKNEIILVFGAIGSSTHEIGETRENTWLVRKQIAQMVLGGLGAKMAIFDEAKQLCTAVKEACPSGEVKLVGMCMGASLAQYAGLQTKTKTICFNSYVLGAGLQQAVGEEKLALADRYVTHISCEKDWASGRHTIVDWIDRIFSFIGIRAPGNFGLRYSIPSAPEYKKMRAIHDYLFGSVVSYLGYGIRTVPDQIKPSDRE